MRLTIESRRQAGESAIQSVSSVVSSTRLVASQTFRYPTATNHRPMARGSSPETTSNGNVAITQRFQDATGFYGLPHRLRCVGLLSYPWLFQMNLRARWAGPVQEWPQCASPTHGQSSGGPRRRRSRLHFPYISSSRNTKLFMKALGHTFSWLGSSWLPTRWYFGKEMFVGYCFGDIAPNVPMSFGPFSLPTMFGMLPMPGMMPMPMKAEFRAGAAGCIKSSPASVSFPIIILQEAVCSVDKQDAYLALFQKKADRPTNPASTPSTAPPPPIHRTVLGSPTRTSERRDGTWRSFVSLCAPLSPPSTAANALALPATHSLVEWLPCALYVFEHGALPLDPASDA